MKLRLLSLLAPLLFTANLACAQSITVAVAANMKDAFSEINAAFKSAGNPDVRIVYGSSGNFTAQIINGAPFNLFISADEHFPIELYKRGKAIDEGVVYATGKLAIISKKSAGMSLVDDKAELISAMNKANKIAIAKLIYGDNIGITTMYVVTGAADLGFTALSLAKSADVSKETNFILVNNKLYEPIKQRMVLIKGAPREAVTVYQFMQSSQAKLILQKYGYSTP
jgi:molybdate transport system substrate-binding protein